MYTSKLLAPGDDLSDAYAVRKTVFIDEQRFDPALDVDEIDPVAHHVVLYDGQRPVATGRAFAQGEPGAWHIGRVAVLPECRGGTGRQLMETLEAEARRRGAACIQLSAQCQARGFYEKLGYTASGEIYLEEHCPHIHMEKPL